MSLFHHEYRRPGMGGAGIQVWVPDPKNRLRYQRLVDIDQCGCVRIYDSTLPAQSQVILCADCTPRDEKE